MSILNDEVADLRSQAVIHHVVPCPTSTLIEHNITCEDAVGLHAVRVADEDPWFAPVVKLADVAKLLDECEAAKDAKVIDRRLAVMPHI